MLLLYKQYLHTADLQLIDVYKNICNEVGSDPILFTDQYHVTTDIAIFHTLFLTKIVKSNDIVIVSSKKDNDIISSLNIQNINNIIIDISKPIDSIILQIQGIINGKV